MKTRFNAAPVFAPPGFTAAGVVAAGVVAAVFVAAAAVWGAPRPAHAAALGLEADECAVQRALLGKAGPDCPTAPAPPPPVYSTSPQPLPHPETQQPPAPAPVPHAGGVSPAGAAPASQPPQAPPDPQPPPPPAAGRRADFLILFDFASDRPAKTSEPLLARIAQTMNAPAAAGLRFRIVGHTDGVGSDAANVALSQRRAAAVKTWLTQRGGVAADRLETMGRGKTQPANPADPRDAANRRVEIIALPR